jgi:hypothetical protein
MEIVLLPLSSSDSSLGTINMEWSFYQMVLERKGPHDYPPHSVLYTLGWGAVVQAGEDLVLGFDV